FFRVWYTVAGSSIYWNGSAWNTGTPNVAVQLPIQVVGSTGTVSWFYPGTVPGQNTPTITQVDGTTYGLAIQALDNAGNLETPTTVQVVVDRVGPLIAITTPTAPYYGTAFPLPTISGTSTDSPAGVAQVQLEINDLTDNLRWNGSSFVAPASTGYVVAIATNPWHLPVAWLGNKQYQIFAQSIDLAGNPSQVDSTATFVYDVNAPSATIVIPNQLTYPIGQPTLLSGTAVDWFNSGTEVNSGLQSVQLALRDQSGNYWTGSNGTGFTAGVKYRSVSTTTTSGATPTTWTYPPSVPAGDTLPNFQDNQSYTVLVHAVDQTGNAGADQSFTFLFDSQVPTTTIVIPVNGSYAKSFQLSSGTYSETGSGIANIYVAVENSLNQFWNGAGPNFGAFNSVNSWRPVTVYSSSWVFTDGGLTAFIAGNSVPAQYQFFVR